MKRFGKVIIGLALLMSLALVLSYCSGSSSDSGTTSEGTASAGAGASVASNAIRAASMGLSAAAGGEGAPSLRKKMKISEAVNAFSSGLRAERAAAAALKAKSGAAAYKAPQPLSCTASGSGSRDTVGNTTTIIYENCTNNYIEPGIGTVSEVMNGTIILVNNGTSFTISLGSSTTPYTDTITLLATSTVLQADVITLTLSGTLGSSRVQCGTSPSMDYNQFTLNMDGNIHSSGFDGVGIAYNESGVLTAFQLVVTIDALDNTCAAIAGTIRESGTMSYTDNLDANGSESLSISSSNPLLLTWIGGQTGDTYLISGTVSMVCPCFTGSFSLMTTTAMFIPTNGECPTAGEVAVSGDVNGAVVYTSAGGVDVKDGTGAVVETYASCNEVHACI